MTMEHDPSNCAKKSRKPYTLTKQRESWTNDEHERFIKALQLYNRDWKKIETYVGTKTVVQIRSHAQKYFQKVIKSGSTDAIPPPRPKRRATDAPLASQASSAFPDIKHIRLTSETSTKAGSTKGEVDSDGGQQNSKPDIGASLPAHDAVEATAQLESARTVVSSQNLQHVYLFLASMFSQAPVHHANMLQQLSDRDRHLATLLLRVLSDELSTQQQQQQQPSQQQPAGTTADSALQQHPAADQTIPIQQQQQQQLQQLLHQQTQQQQQQQQHCVAAAEAAALPRECTATPSLEQPTAAAGPGDPVIQQQQQQSPAAQTADTREVTSGIAQPSRIQQAQAPVVAQVNAADTQAAAVQAAQQQQELSAAAAAAAAMNAAELNKVQLGSGAAAALSQQQEPQQQQQQHKQHMVQNGFFGVPARRSITP